MNIRAIISNVSCFVLILILSFIFLTNTVNAETKTFIKEYTYQAGDEDSRNSSRIISLREVKRLLLEELGTYLESQTEVKNFQITKDQITTLTAGIVGTEVIEDKWDGKVYWLKAKITANPQDVIKAIDSLRNDRAKVKELEELRNKSEELLKENKLLTKQLKTAKGDAKQKSAKAYKQNINNLSATEWFEKGCELSKSGNYTDAVKAFSRAIELNPQDAVAYYNRGVIYHMLGNTQQAINDYNKAIELNQQHADFYYNRGNAYVELGNYQQAINDYNNTIELNPKYEKAYYNRGIAYFNIDNRRLGIENAKMAARLGFKEAQDYLRSKGIDW
jgi:tetratricopeptide (TPR) repeat protein